MSSGSIENRKHPRIEVCITARLEGTAAEVRVSDLSEGGCYIDSIAEVVVGGMVNLNILHGGQWVKLSGMIAHHFPRLGFGIRFVNLDAKQQSWISSVIRPPSLGPTEQVGTSDGGLIWHALDHVDLTESPIM